MSWSRWTSSRTASSPATPIRASNSTYFSTGGGTLSVKGQPDRFVKAGEGFQIPPEVPHKVQNGPERTHVIVTYIVEKDKPLASPAPE